MLCPAAQQLAFDNRLNGHRCDIFSIFNWKLSPVDCESAHRSPIVPHELTPILFRGADGQSLNEGESSLWKVHRMVKWDCGLFRHNAATFVACRFQSDL